MKQSLRIEQDSNEERKCEFRAQREDHRRRHNSAQYAWGICTSGRATSRQSAEGPLGRARRHKIEDGSASGRQEARATWLDYYR